MVRAVSALAVLLCLTAPAPAAEALQPFTESGGCKVLGSATSSARQREIAASGSVTWDGKCVGGLIDGPGVLRHQGSTTENGRTRRFAFYLTGVARAGKRVGVWRRESFNMYTDSPRYWLSLATLNYVDGIARGEAKFVKFSNHAELGQPFRQFLAGIDREIAAAETTPPTAKPGAGAPPAPATPAAAAGAPAPAGVPAPALAAATTPPPAPPPAAAAPAPASPPPPAATPVPAAAPAATASPASPARSAVPPAASPAAAPAPPAAGSAHSPPPRDLTVAEGPRNTAGRPTAAAGRERAFSVLVPAGRGMPPPAPPGSPQQQILEQRHACALERVNDIRVDAEVMRLPASLEITVSGWASDPVGLMGREEPRVPAEAWLRFYARGGGPGLLLPVQRNVERADLARALGHPAHAKSGFRLILAPGQLRPGEYSAAILQRFGADIAVCQSTARLLLE